MTSRQVWLKHWAYCLIHETARFFEAEVYKQFEDNTEQLIGVIVKLKTGNLSSRDIVREATELLAGRGELAIPPVPNTRQRERASYGVAA